MSRIADVATSFLASTARLGAGMSARTSDAGKGGAGRPAFVARSGRMRVPCLADPDTGASRFESADIVAYLEKTYGAA